MLQFTSSTSKKLKVQVSGSTRDKPYYDLKPGEWTTFPLSDGNGSYKVTVFENTTAQKHAEMVSVSLQVTLSNEFAPFPTRAQSVRGLRRRRQLAATVQSVYQPVLDNVLAAKKGICFDYASLTAGCSAAWGCPVSWWWATPPPASRPITPGSACGPERRSKSIILTSWGTGASGPFSFLPVALGRNLWYHNMLN